MEKPTVEHSLQPESELMFVNLLEKYAVYRAGTVLTRKGKMKLGEFLARCAMLGKILPHELEVPDEWLTVFGRVKLGRQYPDLCTFEVPMERPS